MTVVLDMAVGSQPSDSLQSLYISTIKITARTKNLIKIVLFSLPRLYCANNQWPETSEEFLEYHLRLSHCREQFA